MKYILFSFLAISFSVQASIRVFCVNERSFEPVDKYVEVFESCHSFERTFEDALFELSEKARFSAIVYNEQISLRGRFYNFPELYKGIVGNIINEEDTRYFETTSQSPNFGVGLQYSSNQDIFAFYTGEVFIGEGDAFKVMCYDLDQAVEKFKAISKCE